MKNNIVKTIITANNAMTTATPTIEKLFATVSFCEVTACKPCHCAICDSVIERGKMRVKVCTRRQPVGTSFCLDCWNNPLPIKAEKLVTGKTHIDTKYNISNNHKFSVHILFDNIEVKGYLLVHGWTVFGRNGFFLDDSHHAITKFLDELFTSGYPLTVTVNGQYVEDTEECRDVLDMKVRNAVINKSVKR